MTAPFWSDGEHVRAFYDRYYDRDEPDPPLTEDELAEDAIHDAQERDLAAGLYDD